MNAGDRLGTVVVPEQLGTVEKPLGTGSSIFTYVNGRCVFTLDRQRWHMFTLKLVHWCLLGLVLYPEQTQPTLEK